MIAVVDYGAGNLPSVCKALKYVGCNCAVTASASDIAAADGVVLPGVGSFGDSLCTMRSLGLDEVTRSAVASGKPFLGICLGLQMLFEGSEESPEVEGMGLFDGKIVRLPAESGLKIPQIGWNSINLREDCPLFEGIRQESYVYFVHSYCLEATDRAIVSATAEYGREFDCAIWSGNAFATQFHPEKSGETGLAMLRNFAEIVRRCG